MSERVETLAQEFEQANAALARTIEPLSESQWQARCTGEGWPVGVTAHHVVGGHQVIGGMVSTVAAGQPLPPLTWEMLDQSNAQHAQQYAGCTKAETLALLRQQGEAAAATVRGLSDEQLGRTGSLMGQAMSAEQLIQNILIGHVRDHQASIEAAVNAP